jgi:hypothetical protein
VNNQLPIGCSGLTRPTHGLPKLQSPHEAARRLDQHQLARRWGLSHRTLERWRWQGKGLPYLKIGSRVVYRLEDVERYENEQLCLPGSPVGAPCSPL